MNYSKIENETVPENIILNYQPILLDYALNLENKNENVGITLSPIGPILSVEFMENLIARGARKFFNIGIAGGLQKELNFGDIVLCNKAFMEGEKEFELDEKLTTQLKKGLINQRLSFWEGTSWTVASFDEETPDRITRYRDKMIMTVEMETAALASVARNHGLEFASAFVISDIVTPRETKFVSDWRIVFEGLENLYKMALCSF